MKFIHQLIVGCAIIVFGLSACSATKTSSGKFQESQFKVKGICEMCEERIEKAALVRGVQSAQWDLETEMLTVRYNPSIISEMEIQQKVAEAGHDTEDVKASEENYKKLPMCCRYHEVDKH